MIDNKPFINPDVTLQDEAVFSSLIAKANHVEYLLHTLKCDIAASLEVLKFKGLINDYGKLEHVMDSSENIRSTVYKCISERLIMIHTNHFVRRIDTDGDNND